MDTILVNLDSLFIHLLNMSITAGWLVLAVVLLRLVFHKAPKWIHCLLWVLVAVRLICPFSVESVLSLLPSAETVPVDNFLYETPAIHSGVPVVDNAVNPVLSDSFAPQPGDSVNPMQVVAILSGYVWLLGVVLMAVYMLITTLRLKWRVRESVRLQRNVYQCDRIATPFILGVIRPRIYLPTTLSQGDILSVVAHEEAHIKRRDHWWKPLGFLLLAVYWFNPLLWLGYVLLCRDIEAACDQRVIRDMDVTQRKAYSDTLLACSAPRHLITACPLAFGETGVKSRIKAVLNYKKPAFWLVIAAVVATIVAAVCLLTNPKATVSDELDAFLTQVILERNYSEEHTGDAYPTEAHTVFGMEEKDGKTVVYALVLYEEYYVDENGTLQVQSGSHIPAAITVGMMEDRSYYLQEYWTPGDGAYSLPDMKEKFPFFYRIQVDTDKYYDTHHKQTEQAAAEYFGLYDQPTTVPVLGDYNASFTFSVGNWMLKEKMYENMAPADREQYLPVVTITSTDELNAFIEEYDSVMEFSRVDDDGINPVHQMQDAYNDTFFAHNVLLAVYYHNGSSSVQPTIVAVEHQTGNDTLTVLVDVYEPQWQNAMLGQWFLLCEIPYDGTDGATVYNARVRGHVAADHYAAAFEDGVTDPQGARELWRDRLNDEEEQELRRMLERLEWTDKDPKGETGTLMGAFNIDGTTYCVSTGYDVVFNGQQMANFTTEDSNFFRNLFLPRGGSTNVPPYQPVQNTTHSTTSKTTTAQMADNTFTGKVIQVTDGSMLMECYDKQKFTTVWVLLTHYPDLNPQVGEEYTVTHDGRVMETFPPQVTAEVLTRVSSTPLAWTPDQE